MSSPPTSAQQPPRDYRVTVNDIDIPFSRMVMIFVKVGLAAVPAVFILMLAMTAAGFLLGGLAHMLGLGMHGGRMWMY